MSINADVQSWTVGDIIYPLNFKHRIISELGHGKFGRVLLVESMDNQSLFALKTPLKNTFIYDLNTDTSFALRAK